MHPDFSVESVQPVHRDIHGETSPDRQIEVGRITGTAQNAARAARGNLDPKIGTRLADRQPVGMVRPFLAARIPERHNVGSVLRHRELQIGVASVSGTPVIVAVVEMKYGHPVGAEAGSRRKQANFVNRVPHGVALGRGPEQGLPDAPNRFEPGIVVRTPRHRLDLYDLRADHEIVVQRQILRRAQAHRPLDRAAIAENDLGLREAADFRAADRPALRIPDLHQGVQGGAQSGGFHLQHQDLSLSSLESKQVLIRAGRGRAVGQGVDVPVQGNGPAHPLGRLPSIVGLHFQCFRMSPDGQRDPVGGRRNGQRDDPSRLFFESREGDRAGVSQVGAPNLETGLPARLDSQREHAFQQRKLTRFEPVLVTAHGADPVPVGDPNDIDPAFRDLATEKGRLSGT